MRNNQEIVNKILDCAAYCDNCAEACLHEDNVKQYIQCIKLNHDCADICRVTASALSRNSSESDGFLEFCAEISRKCADECNKFEVDFCKECANICHECEEACSQEAHH